MNILVCISVVADPISKINFTEDQKSLDKSNIQWIINPSDEYMLSRAIQLQKTHGAKISVLTIGTEETEPLIRKTLAMGADEAIRVHFSPQDSLSTAKEIAKIIDNQNFDLIFLGKENIDYHGGAVPALLSAMVKIPLVNSCISLEINDNQAVFIRENIQYKETLTAKLPLIISGQKGIVNDKDLIIPNIRGMMMAKSKPIIVKEASAHSYLSFNFSKSPEREKVKFISPDNLEELIHILHEEKNLI